MTEIGTCDQTDETCAEWYKINLTLFEKSHFSQNEIIVIINLFKDIYKV